MQYYVEYIPNVRNVSNKVKSFGTLEEVADFIKLLSYHGELIEVRRYE